MKKPFFITTAITYANGKMHVGHAYEAILTDAIARHHRLMGEDVFFLTGSDEHGLKISRSATKAGKEPQEFVDTVIENFKENYKNLSISYDKFIRTTDKEHKKIVSDIFQKLFEQGDIFLDSYEGWYCVPCESFYTESQLIENSCPYCRRSVELTKEESYFFKMTKYQKFLEEFYEQNPGFLTPQERRNEIVKNFIIPGLEDLSVSRTSFDWGIKVPFDKKHVIYVWIDALVNYISALGYGTKNDKLFQKYWPADYHVVGRDITRFHVTIWLVLLKALNLPLPKQVHSHGFLTLNGEKLSKSSFSGYDPITLTKRYGGDAIRYFALRYGPLAYDAPFDLTTIFTSLNNDLSNDLGNLLSRTSAMVEQYLGGKTINVSAFLQTTTNESDKNIIIACTTLNKEITALLNDFKINDAMAKIFGLVSIANKYIEINEPWKLNKQNTEESKLRNAQVLYVLCETLRVIAVNLQAFLPMYATAIFEQLGITQDSQKTYESVQDFNYNNYNKVVRKGEALFKRVEIEKEVAYLNGGEEVKPEPQKQEEPVESKKQEITIDDFAKLDLRVGTIVDSIKVDGSDKLLKNTVEIEDNNYTIVSGIAKYYEPKDIIGEQVVVVTNLKPIKLKGILSQGMILCAYDKQNDTLALVHPKTVMPTGSEVN